VKTQKQAVKAPWKDADKLFALFDKSYVAPKTDNPQEREDQGDAGEAEVPPSGRLIARREMPAGVSILTL
jgi:hypothetical protein